MAQVADVRVMVIIAAAFAAAVHGLAAGQRGSEKCQSEKSSHHEDPFGGRNEQRSGKVTRAASM